MNTTTTAPARLEGPQTLAEWLAEQDMTQADLARALGFERTIVNLVITGKRQAGGEFRYRFARLTGDLALTERLLGRAAPP